MQQGLNTRRGRVFGTHALRRGGVVLQYNRATTSRTPIHRRITICDRHCKASLVWFSFEFFHMNMKYTWLILASCSVLVLAELLPTTLAVPYSDDGKLRKLLIFNITRIGGSVGQNFTNSNTILNTI